MITGREIPAYPVTSAELVAHYAREAQQRNEGLAVGREEGHAEGQQIGYQQGHRDGRAEGWGDAVTQANVKISEQLEFTRQHVADKAAMQKQLQAQAELIDLLTRRVLDLERENKNLKMNTGEIHIVATALKSEKEQQQTKVTQLDEKLEQLTNAYNSVITRYNSNLIFMNTVHCTLAELARDGEPLAERIPDVFAKKYEEQVSKAGAEGNNSVTLHKDPSFHGQKFILGLLNRSRSAQDRKIT